MNIIVALLLIVTFFVSGQSFGWPENFRLGYQTCSSCHVSPTGGGVLTDYGKSTAEELSTWAFEGEGRTDYGLFSRTPDHWQQWLNLGGDFRYLAFNRADQFDHFRMQSDVEASVNLSKELSLVGSVGVYGKRQQRDYRRHYILYRFTDSFRVRAGRFFPAYGINHPDHTLMSRRPLGFDQGGENYSVEGSYTNALGEIYITGAVGPKLNLTGSKEDGFDAFSQQERATFVRASLFTGKTSQIGASYKFGRIQDRINRMFGVFGTYAPTRNIYFLTDANYQIREIPITESKLKNVFSHSKLGWEVYRGVHAYYSHEWASTMAINGYGFQWLPRPHLELSGVYKVDQLAKSWMLVSHWNW